MRKPQGIGFGTNTRRGGGVIVVLLALALLAVGCASEMPDAVSQASAGATTVPAAIHTPVPTQTTVPAATRTPMPTQTVVSAAMLAPTQTAKPTDTPEPPETPSPTATPTPTATPEPTPLPTATPAPKNTPTPPAMATPAPRSQSDQEVLIAFYQATGGPFWQDHTNWLSDAPLGQWHGVRVDESGRVTKLELGSNQLSGQLPPELGNLAELRTLSVWGNDISGPIPIEIGHLDNLAAIDLGGNRFTGELPMWLGGSSNLTYLSLHGNEFTGQIPETLGALSHLRVLDMRNNRLTGQIPPQLAGLGNLQVLLLARNQFEGAVPAWLGELPKLREVTVEGNRLTGPIPMLFKDRTLAAVKLLSWVADGLSTGERGEYDHLVRSVDQYPLGVATVLDKGWLEDGVTATELALIKYLGQLPPDVLAMVIEMPFMKSVDPADPNAVAALQQLERNDRNSFERIMAHPTIADGIDDEEAKIVTLLYGTNKNRQELVEPLLSGTDVYLEERTIQLPLAGETLLSIIRIRNQSNRLMEQWETAVRNLEMFVGEPFPTNYVALLLAQQHPDDESEGVFIGTHTVVGLLYDETYQWSGGVEEYHAEVFAHELAHYYFGAWGRMRDWMAEGAAQILGNSLSENVRTGKEVALTLTPCRSTTTIAELDAGGIAQPGSIGDRRSDIGNTERGGTDEVDDRWLCNYTLGEGLFLDLYEQLGEETFLQGMGNIYRKTQREDPSDDCEGTRATICHLWAAFKSAASPEEAKTVDAIVNKWYYGR